MRPASNFAQLQPPPARAVTKRPSSPSSSPASFASKTPIASSPTSPRDTSLLSPGKGRFPPTSLDWPALIPLLGPANAAVARYEGVLLGVPNPDVLLAPLTTQEAVLSSRIEGTQATFDEVLTYEAEGAQSTESSEKVADIQEVLNYRAALHHAVEMMRKLPLSERVVKETHAVLMQGVRGQARAPGEY